MGNEKSPRRKVPSGYPVPSAATDSRYVNYPDPDIIDPAQNTSGVP